MNLPNLPYSSRTMYIGVGGGYDIFGAIPIHLATSGESIFVNISNEVTSMGPYEPFYAFSSKLGAKPLGESLLSLVRKHHIDTIYAVDGGVDSLMVGDEVDSGTVLGDFNTMAAIDNLSNIGGRECNPCVILACTGFGCEVEEGMNHYRVLENISNLIKDGGFYGSCSLTNDTSIFDSYKEAVEKYSGPRKSHIQPRIIAAVEGEFGNPDIEIDPNLSKVVFDVSDDSLPAFVNPLMGMYWFFRFPQVVRRNKIIPHIKNEITITGALAQYRGVVTRTRDKKKLPL